MKRLLIYSWLLISLNLFAANPGIFKGAGSPEGVQVGRIGDFWINSSGGASDTLYTKKTGTATTTGWVAIGGGGASDNWVASGSTNSNLYGTASVDSLVITNSATLGSNISNPNNAYLSGRITWDDDSSRFTMVDFKTTVTTNHVSGYFSAYAFGLAPENIDTDFWAGSTGMYVYNNNSSDPGTSHGLFYWDSASYGLAAESHSHLGQSAGSISVADDFASLQAGAIGYTVGFSNGSTNVGIAGIAFTRDDAVGAHAVGVYGETSSGSGIPSDPQLVDAAGLFDNRNTSHPVIVGRTNGVQVFKVDSVGAITTASSGTSAGAWKLGPKVISVSVALVLTNYVEVNINGTVVKLGIVQ